MDKQRYDDLYFIIHGHYPDEPHTSACTPEDDDEEYIDE